MAASLGLAARSTVTPSVLQKMVWAGSNLGSYATAEEAMRELVGVSISAPRIRRAIEQIGVERVAERNAAVERFKELAIPKQLVGSTAVEPPEIGVISMDGGRYQRRDDFGEKDRPPGHNHWREDKVGCLLSMTGCVHQHDPTPELPEWLATSSAEAAGDETTYPRWAGWIWRGQVDRVIGELRDHQHQIGKPPPDASPSDLREPVNRALVYYENHRSRMNYPQYRRLGLPLTSSHIESTIKQINRRVKGSEKFWSRRSSEAILQLRADYLSDSAPIKSFWLRHQARQTGTNAYSQTT